MLQDGRDVMGCAIGATDGEVGEVDDFYFDDQTWTVRYLVVDTGAWLNRRRVLISTHCLGRPQWDRKVLTAAVTRQQVQSSPDIDTRKPVSRRYESLYLSHYQYPCYWEVAGAPAVGPNPTVKLLDSQFGWSDSQFSTAVAMSDRREDSDGDHLRSCNAILSYAMRGRDGEVGQVQGLLFEEDDWAVRYLLVEMGRWWSGHPILVAAQWITEVSWVDSFFSIDCTRETLLHAPLYNPAEPFDRGKETALFEYFGRSGCRQPDTPRS